VVKGVNVNVVLTKDQEMEYQYHSLPFDDHTNIYIVTYIDENVAHADDPPGSVYTHMIQATYSNLILSAIVFGVLKNFSKQDIVDFAKKPRLTGTIMKNCLGAWEMTLTKALAPMTSRDAKAKVDTLLA
jgi:hypothetical protein